LFWRGLVPGGFTPQEGIRIFPGSPEIFWRIFFNFQKKFSREKNPGNIFSALKRPRDKIFLMQSGRSIAISVAL
jgi:hypothetical protein